MATHFFWDPVEDNIVQERDDTGVITAEYATEPYLYGNLISQNRGGVESQYHFDPQGSTLALTNDNQQVTDTYAYSAFGEVTARTGSTVNPFQYIGRSGYYYDVTRDSAMVRHREYRAGRWLSVDPLYFINDSTPSSINAYLYAFGNPLHFIDPSGLCCEEDGIGERARKIAEENAKSVRPTQLVYQQPTGGKTGQGRSGPMIQFQSTIPLTLGDCGKYDWQIQWRRREKTDAKGAFVLQKIAFDYKVYDCDGKEITESCPLPTLILHKDRSAEIGSQLPPLLFWEAFDFGPNSDDADVDNYSFPYMGFTRGWQETVGLYAEVRGPITANSGLISPNPEVPRAGTQPASTTDPIKNDPTLKKGLDRKHSIKVKWDCCPAKDMPPK